MDGQMEGMGLGFWELGLICVVIVGWDGWWLVGQRAGGLCKYNINDMILYSELFLSYLFWLVYSVLICVDRILLLYTSHSFDVSPTYKHSLFLLVCSWQHCYC